MKHYQVANKGISFPYSTAVEAGGFVYVSGQIPVDATTGEIVCGGVSEQTEQVFKNLRAVLALAGTSLEKLVKVTVFLSDMADFQAMNAVYEKQFQSAFPARSAIAVKGIPRGALVEIEAIALK